VHDPQPSQRRDYLFVCGCARSGTSLVTDLLTMHQDIAIGMERYQRLVTQEPEGFEPALFEPERFFDVRPGDTFYDDLEHFEHYGRIRDRYAKARLVGDKVPRLYEQYERIAQRFPGARVIFVTRELPAVAASARARATDPTDSLWPRERGVASAIREWTEAHESTLAAFDDLPIFVLRYETLVKAPDVAPLLAFLGLEDDDGISDMLGWIAGRSTELEVERVAASASPAQETDARLRRVGHEVRAQLRRPPGRRLTWMERRRVDRSGHAQISAALSTVAAARGRLL
jgi:hypothetical protein